MNFYLRALRHGVMRLFSLPRLTLPVLLTLSLTLAAVLTVVAMSSNLIFKPLPDLHNEKNTYRLEFLLKANAGFSLNFFSDIALANMAKKYQSYGKFASFSSSESSVNALGNSYPVTHLNASDNFLTDVGGQLLLGEMPNKENANQSIWISEGLWQGVFSGRKNVIGETLLVGKDKVSLQIRGVISNFSSFKEFESHQQQIWQFSHLADFIHQQENNNFLHDSLSLFVKHERGLTEKDMTDFWDYYLEARNQGENPMPPKMLKSMQRVQSIEKYRDTLLLEQKNMLLFLLATMVILLFMASLNLLSLFVSHYQQRTKELAIQASLGATKIKLTVMAIVENLPLFGLSAVIGLLGAAWVIRLLPEISGNNISMMQLIHIDWQTIVIAVFSVLIINFIFSYISISRFNSNEFYKYINSGNKGISAGKLTSLNKASFVLQLTSAAVVLTASAMLAKAAYQDLYKDLGFDAGNVLIVKASFLEEKRAFAAQTPETAQDNFELSKRYVQQNRQIWQDISADIQTKFPMIEVLDTNTTPHTFQGYSYVISMDSESNQSHSFKRVTFSHSYLNEYKIPLLAGRTVTEDEYLNQANSAVISEKAARMLAKDNTLESVIGKRINSNIVVGIVPNVYSADSPNGEFGVVYAVNQIDPTSISFILRQPMGKEFDVAAIEKMIKNGHPDIEQVKSFDVQQRYYEATLDTRLQYYFIIALSLLTLALAAFGSSGMALSFAEIKRFELAIRMATGASRSRLLQNTLKQFAGLISVTLVLALFVSAAVYFGLQQQVTVLPEFSWSALLFFSSLLVMIVLISIASVVWRVINAEPMQALREL